MIPLPWVVYGLVSSFLNAFLGGISMLVVLGVVNFHYHQRWIRFHYAFAAFALWMAAVNRMGWSEMLWGNGGWSSGVILGGFVGLTLLLKKPFTVQIVEDLFPEEMKSSEHFWRVNFAISLVWGIHFWVSAAVSGLDLPKATILGMTLGSMFVAGYFTKRYPRWYRLHCFLPLVKQGAEPYQPFVEV